MKNDYELSKDFWNEKYLTQQTGWDIGKASTPLIDYLSQYKSKKASVLIPGCGNAYEVDEMLKLGYKNITLIDLSPHLCEKLSKKYKEKVKIICGDFFDLNGTYDLILEQTFFCALNPSLRDQYVTKMYQLLNDGGKLIGVLFNKEFEHEGPPFGGTQKEYEQTLSKYLHIQKIEECYNSIAPRRGNEVFFIAQKKPST